ncbi:MAG: hypothetical protein J6O09_01060 [Lachnospiraceae bacterium]|nr:hypothetical protein [Lachnospiraceae bacterium]
MKQKRALSIFVIISLLFGMTSISFADPTEDLHTGEIPASLTGGVKGPKVEEYYHYKEDKVYKPGSLGADVDLSQVGKGLFYDGTDFYFFVDTGIMATNFMYNIEGDRFFFGDDGKMIRNELISYNDELYYFDANGAMYKNRWYSDESIDVSDNTISYTDYYFGPTGRAYRASATVGLVIKTIEGERYGFNADGEKLEGYYDQNGVKQDPEELPAYEDCVYYFDPEENGAACKGWHYYEGTERGSEYDSNEEIVLYFDEKTCRKVAAKVSATDTERAVSRIIDGQRYAFDANGVRKNSWYSTEPGLATKSNMKFFDEENDGYLSKGWLYAVPGAYSKNGEDLILEVNKKKHTNEEGAWFYAGSNGNILKKTIRRIGNYTYAFDDDGVMQEEALVRVKNGVFVKSYPVGDLTRANVILDPNETGGNADPDPDGVSDPVTLDEKKGILKVSEGEQWMYFGSASDEADENDPRIGAQCKLNAQVKLSLKDSNVYFIATTYGGYTKVDLGTSTTAGTGMTTVLERGNRYIQNGIVLRADKDTDNIGIIRMSPSRTSFDITIPDHSNAQKHIAGDYYEFRVVDSNGSVLTNENKSIKDKQGMYVLLGPGGQFLGYYPYEIKYYKKTPGNLKDANGNPVAASDSPCWAYRDSGEKRWVYGLPSASDRQEVTSLYLNFNETSSLGSGTNFGPYEYGIASELY